MLGIWGSYSSQFLFVIGTSTLVIFGVPMAIWPIQWAKTLRWDIPEKTDLAVYYGRCLGCVAFVVGTFGVLAAMSPAVQVFYFQFLLACWILMVIVHVYEAVKKIQPITETYEIGFWFCSRYRFGPMCLPNTVLKPTRFRYAPAVGLALLWGAKMCPSSWNASQLLE